MAVATGDVLRVTAKMSIVGNDVQNVYHLLNYADPEDDAVVYAGIADVLEDIYGYATDYETDILLYDSINVFNLTQDSPVGEDSWPTITAGDLTGDTYAFQCAPLVLFSTAVARSQGRKYFPPVAASTISGSGALASLHKLALTTAATFCLSAVIAGDAALAWGNWNPTLGRFASWTAAVVKDRVATQRRRVAGVGS